jgi:hypothetical protein
VAFFKLTRRELGERPVEYALERARRDELTARVADGNGGQ